MTIREWREGGRLTGVKGGRLTGVKGGRLTGQGRGTRPGRPAVHQVHGHAEVMHRAHHTVRRKLDVHARGLAASGPNLPVDTGDHVHR